MINAYVIIMAGGNGERFWPLSTSERPKQFVNLFGAKPLIRHAVDRLEGLIATERIFVITADRFVGLTHEVLPMLPAENIIGEPCRRDTAAVVAVACGLVLRYGGSDAIGCILTADQLIGPTESFQRTLADSVRMASVMDAIVTMGIVPTRPDTGFGYIEYGGRVVAEENRRGGYLSSTSFCEVKRFVEKPDAKTAEAYLAQGNFLWNAGMFIWKASVMRGAFQTTAPDFMQLIEAVSSTGNLKDSLNALYPALRAISVDFAVMEQARQILVAECNFMWDDVGGWLALEKHFAVDRFGNTQVGESCLRNDSSVIVLNQDVAHKLVVAGLSDAVVVHTKNATLVCSKSELPKMRDIVREVTR